MSAPYTPHTTEDLEWLIKQVLDLTSSGAANYVSEAVEACLPEWIARTGRPCTASSLRHTLDCAARNRNVELPVMARGPGSGTKAQKQAVNAQEMAHAGYAVWIPGNNGQVDQFRLFETSGQVSELINQLVRENLGMVPKGIKIFGEIVPDVQVQVTWKNRGLPVLAPGHNA